MVLIGAIRYMFLSKAMKEVFKSRLQSPYDRSINAFRLDMDATDKDMKTIRHHNSQRNIKIRKNGSSQDHSSSRGLGYRAESRDKHYKTELSEILADADKRSSGTVVNPKREQLIEMMRLLYRKQQKIFDGLSPTRRKTLRMIAEHMLGVDPDDKQKR